MNEPPKVAVQYLTAWRSDTRDDIDKCLSSLEKVNYPKDNWCIVITDNETSLGSFYKHLVEKWLPKSEKTLPKIFLHRSRVNLGFAGGHEQNLKSSKEWGADYIYLLNEDAYCDPEFLSKAVLFLEEHVEYASAQSRVMLAQDESRLDSCGNCLHFLGFGFTDGHGMTLEEANKITRPHFYRSGAGLIIRMSVFKDIKYLFEPKYFLYHEDVDFAWRSLLAGYDNGYAKDSVIFHRYEFSRSIQKFYWMERNRILTHLTHFKIPTLLFILPAFIIMEVGTLFFAIRSGWFTKKISAWFFFLRPSTWLWIKEQKKNVRDIRKVKDKEILKKMVGVIDRQEVNNFLLNYIVNPILSVYFFILKKIVWW